MGVNDDLLAPLQSESFYTHAAYGAIHVPKVIGNPTEQAGPLALDFWYDADTGKYWLVDGTLVQSFSSADISSVETNPAQKTYKKVNGSTTDTLILADNGTTNGRTRYVGAGLFYRLVDGVLATDGRFDAFTYGMLTADASMPVTGAASFDVVLTGAYTSVASLYLVHGTGELNIDFANGAMGGSGWYNLVNLANNANWLPSRWDSSGMLTADTNDFTGVLRFTNIGDAKLTGSFYGPAADELGAVWYVDGDGASLAGMLYGARGDYPINQITELTFPEYDAIFTPLATSVRADRNDGTGLLANPTAYDELKAVYLRPGGSGPTYYRDPSYIVRPPSNGELTYELYPTLSFARVGQMLDLRANGAILDSFAYGLDTDPASIPVTGSAHYLLGMHAGLMAPGKPLQTITGGGDMYLEFATGNIDLDGNYRVYGITPANGLGDGVPSDPPTDQGSWSGTAALTSNGFTGTLLLDGTTDYSGTLAGRLFGPHVDEIGAVFALAGGGAQVSGTLGGWRSDQPYYGNHTLADLIEPATLLGGALATYKSNADGYLRRDQNEVRVNYDPDTNTYSFATFYTNYYSLEAQFNETLGPDDATDEVDPGFVHYAKGDASGRILAPGPGNPVVDLTYMRFAHFTAPGIEDEQPAEIQHFMYFGLATVAGQMPKLGSASYSGVVFGRGVNPASGPVENIGGTSAMEFDFETRAFTATLDLHIEGSGSGDIPLGSFAFEGGGSFFAAGEFYGTNADNSFQGLLGGRFYGPGATEFGADWSIEPVHGTIYPSSSYFYGVTVGKQVTPP